MESSADLVARAIAEAAVPKWTDIVTMAASAVVAFTAVAAAIYGFIQVHALLRSNRTAKDQLTALAESQETTVRIEKARFLFMLDQMFESAEFTETRRQFFVLLHQNEKEVDLVYRDCTPDERRAALGRSMSAALFAIKEHDQPRYLTIMKVCGFF